MSVTTKRSEGGLGADVYGLVLAGGRSTRMGRDKSMLAYRGRPQVEIAFELLGSVCSRVFISNREDQHDAPGHAGKPQLHDRYDNLGPMGGLLTAFDAHPNHAWLALACDLPFLDRATLEYLIAHRDAARCATAFRGAFDGLPEPLCAIYEPAMRERLHQFAREGITCPRKALIRSDTALLDLPNPRALENANAPEDFDTACAAIAAKGTATLGPRGNGKRECDACPPKQRTIRVRLYALLREKVNQSELELETAAHTAHDVYGELQRQFGLPWPAERFSVAVNDEFCGWDRAVRGGDCVHVIPPVAGG